MRRTFSVCLGLALLIPGLTACGTYSIPRVAARGTTILFTVPDAFGAGFGRALNGNLSLQPTDLVPSDNSVSLSPALDDLQRGELLFALRDGPHVSSTKLIYLPVRYITRVHADEASEAAMPDYDYVGTPIQSGQVVAFVDIPYDTPSSPTGEFYVFVERWRRRSDAPNLFEMLPAKMINYSATTLSWFSWGGTGFLTSGPDAGMRIRIVAPHPDGAFVHFPARGFDRWDGSYSSLDHAQELDDLVPHSNLRIRIVEPVTLTVPAAWEITLAYPAGTIEVTGATLGRIRRSSGLVSVTTTSSPLDCDGPGTAKISLIDPERKSYWVDVVYKLRNFVSCGRAQDGDFQVLENSVKAYDLDGAAVPSFAFLDPEYSF